MASTQEVSGGQGRFYEMRIQPYLTVDKKVDGAVLSLVDITDRKKLENEQLKNTLRIWRSLVEERTKQLKDSERLAAIGATAGMVGHDIRNPLQAITGDVYLAKTELVSIPESDEKKNALESLRRLRRTLITLTRLLRTYKTLPDHLTLMQKKQT